MVENNGKKYCIGLISNLLSGYDLPSKIFKLYRWEAFSKVKFYKSRNIFLTDFMTFLFFKKINLEKSPKILSKIIIYKA
jgi:hypothetical protein